MRGRAHGLGVLMMILLSGCSVGVEMGSEEPDYSYAGPMEESDCISETGGNWHEVSCTAPDAQATVTKASTAQGNQRFTLKPDCPPQTDLAFSQPGTSTQSYICARNLKAPHPGDPGMGGGTIDVGDCLHTDEPLDEVPCDGSGAKPQYKILQITRKPCPKDTTSFSLGSPDLSGTPEGGFACTTKL